MSRENSRGKSIALVFPSKGTAKNAVGLPKPRDLLCDNSQISNVKIIPNQSLNLRERDNNKPLIYWLVISAYFDVVTIHSGQYFELEITIYFDFPVSGTNLNS